MIRPATEADLPFIVLGLPRSRTAWLAKFLTYGDHICGHEELRHCRSLDDVKAWLAMPQTGSAETAAASGSSTVVGISLPIASNFAASTDASGSAASAGVQQAGAVEADATNDRAQMRYISVDTSGRGMFFTFSYRVI